MNTLKSFVSELRAAAIALAILTVLCGVLYPAVVTAGARVAFPKEAGGSLVHEGDRVVGSALLGQPFDDPKYLWGRPSATAPYPYNAAASGASNLGPTNPVLREAVVARIAALRTADPDNHAPIPSDLVTASASGLDPHVSPAAALYQVGRIARARNLEPGRVRALVLDHIEAPAVGVLGQPRVNVLAVNRALDAATASASR